MIRYTCTVKAPSGATILSHVEAEDFHHALEMHQHFVNAGFKIIGLRPTTERKGK